MTPNFTLVEFTRSGTAAHLGIDNTLPAQLRANALDTLSLLERIRAHLCQATGRDVAVTINSGYRSPALNWAVRRPMAGPGFDATGDHPRAMAADFVAPAFGTPLTICQALQPWVDQLGIGQLIYECGWVHVSTQRPGLPWNRVITKVADGYVTGIVA